MVFSFGNITIGPTPLIAPGDMLLNFYVDVHKKLPRNMQVCKGRKICGLSLAFINILNSRLFHPQKTQKEILLHSPAVCSKIIDPIVRQAKLKH